MFKFTDLSDNDEFKAEDYRLNPKEFFEKRRTSRRPYVFDLRSANDYELSHLRVRIICPSSILRILFIRCPFPETFCFMAEKTVRY
ncbi:MAG: hypothetical protein Ct9H90mP9_2940 [Pseudomonadota bacterium]|nr:MAG: hypothetical protein Ct9H90mP9_2940 [Pseudomonadota bacterium]